MLRPVPDELLTRHELAERMRVSVATVDRLRKERPATVVDLNEKRRGA